MLLPLLHALPAITPSGPRCVAVLGALHAFVVRLCKLLQKKVEGSPGAAALLAFRCLPGAWSGCVPPAEPSPACTQLGAPGDAGGNWWSLGSDATKPMVCQQFLGDDPSLRLVLHGGHTVPMAWCRQGRVVGPQLLRCSQAGLGNGGWMDNLGSIFHSGP